MASIRNIKKDINIITYDLLSRCYALKGIDNGIEDERFDEVIKKIVYLRNDLILRTNHPETDADSSSIKGHFKKVQVDLYELMEVIEELKKS